mgnify:CR=1 FL=1
MNNDLKHFRQTADTRLFKKAKKESVYSFGADQTQKFELQPKLNRNGGKPAPKLDTFSKGSSISPTPSPLPTLGKIGNGIGQKIMGGYPQAAKGITR